MRRGLTALVAACVVGGGVLPVTAAVAAPQGDVVKTWDATVTSGQVPA
ncbi:hypothetical protein ACFFQW_48335 [Umezawaea endophytica]|uniref:Uncharacterized protein n=1 Tax=Umezawaea endophytica TaxID=1654476 RepID=A0A9X2VL66_9PSEU|nr:hypothetical protein [Umezawaea endophytica]MCS7478610.1 hypothetical protein [Umezawaea endophytica]